MIIPSMTFMSLLILSSVLLSSQLIVGNATAQTTPPYTFTAQCGPRPFDPGLQVTFTFTSGEIQQGGASVPFYVHDPLSNQYLYIEAGTATFLFGGIGEPGETYTATVYVDTNDNFQTVGPEENELIETVSGTCPSLPPGNQTPAEAVDDLISDIEDLGEDVPQGTKTSLAAPLKQVSEILSDDNPNNDGSACNRLNAFIDQANTAETRGDITQEQADDLINQAEEIREAIGC